MYEQERTISTKNSIYIVTLNLILFKKCDLFTWTALLSFIHWKMSFLLNSWHIFCIFILKIVFKSFSYFMVKPKFNCIFVH